MKKKTVKLSSVVTKDSSKNLVPYRKLIQPILSSALITLVNAPHPVKVSFEIMKANEAFKTLLAQYEAFRSTLLNKHGKKDAEGKLEVQDGRYVLENKEAFDKEFEELLDIEVETPRLPASYLTDLPDIRLSPAQLSLLADTILDMAG